MIMRAPKGIKPSPMDTGYDKVKNLDPSQQILVIYKSEDKFTVSLGVSGFLSRLAKEILGEPDESWNTKPFQVPMTAKYKNKTHMLVPASEEDRVISAEEFPYRKCIGALLWANVVRPDICQAVRQLSRFCLKPTEKHVEAQQSIC